jgi:reactive intermediate/imine deaminase
MDRQQINPWTWQDAAGFSQAWRVDAAGSLVFVAGQGPVSPDGQLVAKDDFDAQVRQTFENMRTVLDQSGASFESIVKLTVYLTDIAKLRDFGRVRSEFITGPAPASTAVQIGGLALPGMMVEVEAIAVL